MPEELPKPQAFLNAEGKVHMVDELGTPVTVAPEEVHSALESGFQLDSKETIIARRERAAQETIPGQIQTAAEGFARGATFGLSDPALVSLLGEGYRKDAELRRQVNPITRHVSEFVGVAGPALASGGTSLAGRALAATPAGLVARGGAAVERAVAGGLERVASGAAGRAAAKGAGMGAAGAVEGAGWGLGEAVSDTALKGEPLTAEKALAAMGKTALWGGALGLGLGAPTSYLASKAAPLADKLATKSFFKSMGASKEDLRSVVGREAVSYETKLADLKDTVMNYRLKTGANKGKTIFDQNNRPDDYVRLLDQGVKETGAEVGAVRLGVSRVTAAKPEVAPQVSEFMERVNKEILEPLRGVKTKSAADDVRTIEAQLEPLVAGPNLVSFESLEAVRRKLADDIHPPPPAGGGVPRPAPPSAEHLEKVERLLDNYLDEVTERALKASGISPEGMAQYLSLQKTYGHLKDARGIANKAAISQYLQPFARGSDYGVGTGIGLAALFSGNLGSTPFSVLHYGLPVAGAALIAHKVIKEYGQGYVADLAQRVAAFSKKLDTSAAALAGLTAKPKVSHAIVLEGARELRRQYDSVSEQVQTVNSNPQAMASLIEQHTADAAPVYRDLAWNMAGVIQGDAAYLASKLPQGTHRYRGAPDLMTTKVPEAKLSRSQMKSFLAAAEALSSPDLAIARIASGNFNKDTIEALEIRRPEIFRELRDRVSVYVSQRQDELSYQRRIYLSTVFKFQGDWSMTPEGLGAIQQALTPVEEPGAQSGGGGGSSSGLKESAQAMDPNYGAVLR